MVNEIILIHYHPELSYFRLVSLFNGISTFVCNLMPKLSLQKGRGRISWLLGNKCINIFPKCIRPKLNVIVKKMFEHTYVMVTIQHFNHYATKTSAKIFFRFPFLIIRWYVVPSIIFQTFFLEAFKIGVDPWKFSVLLLYILWNDWPIFMKSGLNEQLQQELETPY